MEETEGQLQFKLVYIVSGLITFVALVKWCRSNRPDLSHIPTILPDVPLLSFVGFLWYAWNSTDVLERSYHKYKGGSFRVPELFRWHVIITGKTAIDELAKADEDVLSFTEAMDELLQNRHIVGLDVAENPFHLNVVRESLTRNLGALYPSMRDEMVKSIRESIPLCEDWTRVRALDSVVKITSRATNRILVGLPLCRDPEYLKLATDFTLEYVKSGFLVGLFPDFLRGFMANYISTVESVNARTQILLGPLIKERLRMMQEHGEGWSGKPNDVLSWLIDSTSSEWRTVPALTIRILILNFSSIHTTSVSLIQVLQCVAAFPQYLSELRDEVDKAVEECGWTKEALGRMTKMDSFIKETSRYFGVSSIVMSRKAMRDYTFSDGTYIPEGTMVSTSSRAIHFDDENYDHAEVFDPWRFTKLREDRSDSGTRQMGGTSTGFLVFGLGRHACPGRHFASMAMKSLLADLVHTYDIKSDREGILPKPTWLTTNVLPNRNTEIFFRKRKSGV